jgi:Arc/MetJ-type ribon-helix-helix transcriptional regulator
MLGEIRIPVNAKIPKSLHDSLVAAVEADKFKDKTTCITEALEKLLYNTQEEMQDNTSVLREMEMEIQKLQTEIQLKYVVTQSSENEIQNYKNVLQNKESEIHRLQNVIREAPDSVEFAEARANLTGLQRLTEEKDKRIDDLTKEVETLNVFAHYFKNVEVKQIEAPVAEKKKPWYKFW